MLVDIQTASPIYKVSQQKAADEIKKRMSIDSPATGRLIDMASAQSGILNRFVVVPDGEDNVEERFYNPDNPPSTEKRMALYEVWANTLAENAVSKLFKNNNVHPEDITRVITISCTGFAAPGFDYHLINKTGIPANVKRTHIGFMGCSAAIIGLNNVLEILQGAKKDENILLLALEICSIHLQLEPTRDNILANMIFADGAAAALFTNKQNIQTKLKIVETYSSIFKDSSEFMGWKIGNEGFKMVLSSELPRIILSSAVPEVKNILQNLNIDKNEIKYWALHPGGRAILDSLQKGLELSEEQMKYSRDVLYNYGNMSSASILFVIKNILDNTKIEKDEILCAIAFGPGLSMEVAILKGI